MVFYVLKHANHDFTKYFSPVPTISWWKVNGPNPTKARLRKSQAMLEIPNVQLEDAGTYECKAENVRGRNVFRGQLQVYSTFWMFLSVYSWLQKKL